MTTMGGDYFGIKKDLVTVEECQEVKRNFYNCVIEKKTQLSQTLPNDQWKTYLNQVDLIQLGCGNETNVKNCASYFSLFDITY